MFCWASLSSVLGHLIVVVRTYMIDYYSQGRTRTAQKYPALLGSDPTSRGSRRATPPVRTYPKARRSRRTGRAAWPGSALLLTITVLRCVLEHVLVDRPYQRTRKWREVRMCHWASGGQRRDERKKVTRDTINC
jgi:hypothetical protein